MVHIKESLLLIGQSSPCGTAGFFTRGARCSSVVRAFAVDAMGRRINSSWWTHWTRERPLNRIGHWCSTLWTTGARCSSVVRMFAHGVMGRRINSSWWTHWEREREGGGMVGCIHTHIKMEHIHIANKCVIFWRVHSESIFYTDCLYRHTINLFICHGCSTEITTPLSSQINVYLKCHHYIQVVHTYVYIYIIYYAVNYINLGWQ